MTAEEDMNLTLSELTLLSMLEIYEDIEWYHIARQEVPLERRVHIIITDVYKEVVADKGRLLLAAMAKAYSSYSCNNDEEKQWLRTVARDPFISRARSTNATLADVLDAMAVLATDCCMVNHVFLNQLLEMCKDSRVRVMLCAMERLHAVFMEILPNAKLRYVDEVEMTKLYFLFEQLRDWIEEDGATWDSLNPMIRLMVHSILYEDYLKSAYAAYIQIISDNLEKGEMFVKRRMLDYVLEMMTRKPEQEGRLMDILVSNLFQGDRQLSLESIKRIEQLLEYHPGMKEAVLKRICKAVAGLTQRIHGMALSVTQTQSVRRLKSLPTFMLAALKGMHRCVVFVSEMQLNSNETRAAKAAINVYALVLFFIFSKSNICSRFRLRPLYEYDEFSRLTRCVTTGLERCVALVRGQDRHFSIFDHCYNNGRGVPREAMEEIIATLYRAAANPISLAANIGILGLLARLQPNDPRFYTLLYKRLLDIRMLDSAVRNSYLRLLNESINNDDNIARITMFVRRLLQISASLIGTDVSSQIAYICRNVINRHPSLMSEASLPEVPPVVTETGGSGSTDEGHHIFNQDAEESRSRFLWERYLLQLSYHPSLVADYGNMFTGPNDRSINLNAVNIFQELGAISGQLRTGDFAYTQEDHWTENRAPQPHQRLFKRYHTSKLRCGASVRNAGGSVIMVNGEAVNECDLEPYEELSAVELSDADLSGDERRAIPSSAYRGSALDSYGGNLGRSSAPKKDDKKRAPKKSSHEKLNSEEENPESEDDSKTKNKTRSKGSSKQKKTAAKAIDKKTKKLASKTTKGKASSTKTTTTKNTTKNETEAKNTNAKPATAKTTKGQSTKKGKLTTEKTTKEKSTTTKATKSKASTSKAPATQEKESKPKRAAKASKKTSECP